MRHRVRDLSHLLVITTAVLLPFSRLRSEESPAPKPAPAPASASSRIVDGTNVPQSQFPTVGEVGDASGTFCTGTLISPRHVLSAAHCVTNDNGTPSLGKTEGRFRIGGKTYSTSDIIVHPTYNGNIEVEGVVDLSILVLDTPVTGVTPTPLNRVAPKVGQLLTLAGYGVTGNGTTGVTDNSPVPAAGTIDFGTTPIDEVTGTFIKWNFDNRTGAAKESNTAPGDSGGPAFLTVNGVLYLAGVTSGGSLDNAGFGDHSYDTRVDPYVAWIDSIAGTSGTPTLSVSGSAASEIGPADGAFTITRTGGDNSVPLTVNFAISGTATPGTDYSSIGTSVQIPAGAGLVTVKVSPVADNTAEGTETVVMTMTAPTGYTLGMGTATVKILETPLVKITSGPTANPSPAAARESVSFNAAANLQGATFSWNFGDGSAAQSGASVTHTYSAGGAYNVSVTASDASGDSTDTKTIALTVNGFSNLVDASITRPKVNLNFRNPGASRFEFKIASNDFQYFDRFDYLDNVDGTDVDVFIGSTQIDTLSIFNTRGFGQGTLTWNPRKGEITYRLKSAKLVDMLATYGAVNDDTVTRVAIPVYIMVGDSAYGGEASLSYKAKLDRTGMGK